MGTSEEWKVATQKADWASKNEQKKLAYLKGREFEFEKDVYFGVIGGRANSFVKYHIVPISFVVLRLVGTPTIYLKCELFITDIDIHNTDGSGLWNKKQIRGLKLTSRGRKELLYGLIAELESQIRSFNRLIGLEEYLIKIDDDKIFIVE